VEQTEKPQRRRCSELDTDFNGKKAFFQNGQNFNSLAVDTTL